MVRWIVVALSLWTSVNGFAPGKPLHQSARFSTGMLATVPQETETVAAIAKEPQMMDQDLYNFNKLLIDTVYDLICFIYPVTGGKRDFARFFVLETVARVPYFAYLSVLHLRSGDVWRA